MDVEDLIDALRKACPIGEVELPHVEIEVQHGQSGELMGYSTIGGVEVRRPESGGTPFLVIVAKIEP
jgi:hypothetical protein